ncbi:MAG: Gfo/Idh/MocA family oxidoreductase [Planctomycetes bacterium]|nr:Gfo/Idh/MocA family oxidoreductase [Planctomycetota bacterium]
METLKVGVIGLRMGYGHVKAYAAQEGVEVVAVCDKDEEKLQQAVKEFGCDLATTDGEELIAREDLDIVGVCTPDHFHAPLTIAALKAGKHVLCEKPMAPTWQECLDMVKAADEAGKKFMIGQSYRFNPTYAAVKQPVAEGRLGTVFYVESQYWNNLEGIGGVGNWRNDPNIRHPFLGGCHALDLTRFIAGNIVEVTAVANHLAFEAQPTDDCITAHLVFESGAIGRALVSSGCKCPFSTTLSVYGTKGTIDGGRICLADGKEKKNWQFEELSKPDMPPPIDGETAAFVKSIRDDTTPPVDGRNGARTMAACFAVIESAAKGGAPVKVNNDF